MAKPRKRSFSMVRLAHPPPLIFGLEHGPRQGDRGSRQEVSKDMAGEASGPEAFTLLLLLLMTHFDRIDRERGYT